MGAGFGQDNVPIEDWAGAVVNADGTVLKQRGCALQAYTPGSGVYAFALDKGISQTECIAVVTLRTPQALSNLTTYVNHVSDTVKNVEIVNASSGAEQAFSVEFRKLL